MFTGCTIDYTPKPRGFLRVDLPSHVYLPFSVDTLPYGFQVSQWATVKDVIYVDHQKGINVYYPACRATLYCTYADIPNSRLEDGLDECCSLALRAARNPQKLRDFVYEHPEEKIGGMLFLLDEGAATPLQFFLTDSVHRLFRGALYYDQSLNADSLDYVTTYLQEEIQEIMQTFYWK